MQIPWFRLVCMLAFMRQGDEPGAQLAHIAHFALSWGLTEAVTPLGRAFVLRAQARAGQITMTHARAAGKVPVGSTLVALGIAAVALGLLLWHGHTQMPLFLLCTTGVLPLFQSAVWPRAWPAAPALAAALAAIWAWEGVRPLFVGLLLFQAVPVVQELAARAVPSHRRAAQVLIWWATTCAVLPLMAVAFGAMYAPEFLFTLIDPTLDQKLAAVAAASPGVTAPQPSPWPRRFLALQAALGAGRGPDDPWRVLGVARGASAREIKKRVRELSLAYHPDKTGPNPMAAARFLQIQAAAERLTKKEWAADAAKAAAEAARDAATRCVESVFVIGIWLVISAFTWLASLFARQPTPEQAAAAQAAMAAAAAGGGAATAPEVRVGPSFMGASMLGLAAPATVRGAAAAAPLPRLEVQAAAAAAEAERRAKRAGPQGIAAAAAPMAAQPQAAAGDAGAAAAAALPPQRTGGGLAALTGWVFGKPKPPPEKRVTGKERRAAKRAGDAPQPAAAAAAAATHVKAA